MATETVAENEPRAKSVIKVSATATFWPGVAFCAVLGLVFVGLPTLIILGKISVLNWHYLSWIPKLAFALGLSGALGYFVWEKKKFSLSLDERAIWKYLDRPLGIEFTAGDGFALPFTSVEKRNVDDIEISVKKQNYVTRDGFTVLISASGVVTIDDLTLVSTVPADRDTFITTQYESALRKLVLTLGLELTQDQLKALGNKELDAALAVSGSTALFKSTLKQKAISEICEIVNADENGLKKYGLIAVQALILEAEFEGRPEEAAQRTLAEIIEGPALVKDAQNKTAVMDTMLEFAKAKGVDISKMTLLEYKELWALAAAMEGKGVGFQQYGGLTGSTMVNVGNPSN